ncbi:MAG: ADP-ribosylglycohydrolase family protein [Acidimicrobiia bacterium]|nr:ADP-ribosylglycohydrolase family protein [Acidimicrobiia bacterium]MDH3397774.1 ADP-ribosylglycohydrolase family protein [Acidimicrobiia bacterium]MDH5614918.1 ADP-ribosylglycohydrolase family protein [Acidimicrobiia bacterium]
MTDTQGPILHSRKYDGGGSGAVLGAAAGEVLAAGQDRVYGFLTQLNVITAYHLLRWGTVDPDRLGNSFAAFAFPERGFDVYRSAAPWFRAWLEEHRRGSPAPMPFENAGAAARMVPIGVWFRKDPVALVDEAIRGAMITHNQEGALVAACSLAGAVAGASFGQSGQDLVFGAAEVAKRAEARIADVRGTVAPPAGSPPLSLLLRHSIPLVGMPFREVAEQIRSWTPNAAAVAGVVTSIVTGAPILERPSVGVREAVAIDFEPREVAVMTGAIVGARVGPHRWPWQIVNDLWFAELGRRLASMDARYEDLPDAYAVEEVLTFAGRSAQPAEPTGSDS